MWRNIQEKNARTKEMYVTNASEGKDRRKTRVWSLFVNRKENSKRRTKNVGDEDENAKAKRKTSDDEMQEAIHIYCV